MSENSTSETEYMERLNKSQKEYYEAEGGILRNRGNVVTRTWTAVRGRVANYRTSIGVKEDMRKLHFRWFGDLSNCEVMELGCASGNSVSRYLAEHAKSYLGVDLNSVGVERLKKMLQESQLPGTAVAVDFLSKDFTYGPFDVIYAQGVLHHFRYFDAFLKVLSERMKPGGRVVAFDPLQTAWVPRVVRAAYRPFQSDADWEWPFHKKTFDLLEKHFEIRELQGFMGWSKWGILALPLGNKIANRIGCRLHNWDMQYAKSRSRPLWRCMNVATLLIKL